MTRRNKHDAGLAEVKVLALARNLETLQNAATLARTIKRENPNNPVVHWCDKMEWSVVKLTEYLVPDQLEDR